MGQAIQLQNHPFRFLLYLEWGLLTVAIVSALEAPPARMFKEGHHRDVPPDLPAPWIFHGLAHHPLMAIIPLVLLGVMGLYLPLGKLPRLVHTLGQIVLILLASATVFNSGRIFPFVYLVLVIRSCLMFGLVGRLTMAAVTFGLFLAGLQFRLRSLSGIGRRLPPQVQRRLEDLIMGLQLNFIVLFGLSLLLVVLLINALLTERQSQMRLQQANLNLRQSAQAIEKLAMDQERSRIARDIHDALGHALTALNIQLESALKLSEKDPPRAQKFLKEAKRLGTQSLEEVRQSVATLRQDPLNGDSLEGAIRHLLDDLQNDATGKTPLSITQAMHISRPLPANINAILYRIVQEGLTNIVKHAQASHVHLQMVASETTATLTLEDDGMGFARDRASTGFGLQSMRDRAEAAGGTFTITALDCAIPSIRANQSSPANSSKSGTRLQVSLPLPASIY
jgi:signal transduction histidine kinase